MATTFFTSVFEAELFTIVDETGSSDLNGLTVARGPLMPERPKDGLDADGLWSGHLGAGYVDMGGDAGDAVQFTLETTLASDYVLSFRYANGSGRARPMTLSRDGDAAGTVDFASTGAWDEWRQASVRLSLPAGETTFQLSNVGSAGPNLDRVALMPATFRIEAESLPILEGYAPRAHGPSSGEAMLQAAGPGEEQRAAFVFDGATGVYDIGVRHYDENDAIAQLGLFVNGVAKDVFDLDQQLGGAGPGPSTLTTRVVRTPLQPGDVVELRGFGVYGEPIRVDALDFAFVSGQASGAAPLVSVGDDAPAAAGEPAAIAGVSVSDADDDRLVVTVRAEVGALAVGSTAATVFVSDGGATVAVAGTSAQIADALEGLSFTAPASFAGETTVTVTASDGEHVTVEDVTVQVVADLDPDIAARSLDAGFFDNRLHFSWLDVNDRNALVPRDSKTEATVQIANEGAAPLTLTGAVVQGPFALVDPTILDGVTLQSGETIDVAVRFDRDAFEQRPNARSGVVDGLLEIFSDDPDEPTTAIDLAAHWQRVDQGGWEPNVNEVWEVFGFGNVLDGLPFRDGDPTPLFNGGLYEQFDETEVLSPFWTIAEGVDEARVTMIARYSGPESNTEPMLIHAPLVEEDFLLSFDVVETDTQTLMPRIRQSEGGPDVAFDPVFASATFTRESIPEGWRADGVFSIIADDFSTDPSLNPTGDIPEDAPPEAVYGHWLRMFQAFDGDGAPIPNTYLGIQDLVGINGDFNDTMFLIEGVQPFGEAPTNTAPDSVEVVGGQPFAFTGDDRIRMDDPDAGLTPLFNAFLSVGHGVLSVDPASGAEIEGDGTAMLALSGTPPEVNRALRSLVYTPEATFVGADTLRLVTNDRSLSDEDLVAITVTQGPAVPVLAGLDDAAADARLVFSRINADHPTLRDNQTFRDMATIDLVNEGSQSLTVFDVALSDPENFEIVGPTPGTVDPGERASITIRYVGVDPSSRDPDAEEPRLARAPEFHEGKLTVTTSAGAVSAVVAGLAQFASENGQEPQPSQLARAFGYGTDIPLGELPVEGGVAVVETIGDEILAPYFVAADPEAPVEIIQIGSFLGSRKIDGERVGDVARLSVHEAGSAASATELFAQASEQHQSVLPDRPEGGQARAQVDVSGPFGVVISVDGRPTYTTWSDPGANETDPALREDGQPLTGDGDARTPDGGHILRYFVAREADGTVIPDTYLAFQDYPGAGNFDFNDHAFLIRNVSPLSASSLPDSIDADGDGVNDVLTRDLDGDGIVAFFDDDDAPTRIEAEDMVLAQGFVTVSRPSASGGRHIAASGDEEQIARHVFSGREGAYDLRLGHFDENDSVAFMRILVNGTEVDSFHWNQDTGSASPTEEALIERAVEDVALMAGDVIELRGFGAFGEPLRTDYLDLAWNGDLIA